MTAHSVQYRGLNIRFEQGDLVQRTDEGVAISCDTGFAFTSPLCNAFVNLSGRQLRTTALAELAAQYPNYDFNSPIALRIPAIGQIVAGNLIILPINGRFRNHIMSVFQKMFESAIQGNIQTLAFPPIGSGGYNLVNHYEFSQAVFDALKSLQNFGSLTTITLINTSAYWNEQYFNALNDIITTDQQTNPIQQPEIVAASNNARTIQFSTAFDTLTTNDVKELYEKRKNEKDSEQSNSNGKCADEDDDRLEACPVCLNDMLTNIEEYKEDDDDITIVRLKKCSHVFHRFCILKWFVTKTSCPFCSVCCMDVKGNQPTDGIMRVQTSTLSAEGFPDVGHIRIEYSFPSGIQTDEHPNPGNPYSGTFRVCYLPNNDEGKVVKELLRIAFNRRLIFTVGESLTTGRKNTVVWSGIHHKTSLSGGPALYGFPDETYFQRVKEELASFGITEALLNHDS